MRKIVPAFLCFLIILGPAYTESIRGAVVAIIDPQTSGSESGESSRTETRSGTRFSSGELVVLQPESFNPMSEALEIEIAIPEAVRDYRGSYAVYLYKKVTPEPASGVKNYRAEAINFYLLPPSSRFNLHLPLAEDYSIQESFDVLLVDSVLSESDFPLVLTILPVMKGIPSAVASSHFEVFVTYAASSFGVLKLDIAFPDAGDLPYTLTMDGKAVRVHDSEFVLKPGLHTLELASPNYVNESVTFSVEAGANTALRLELERRSSWMIVEAPEGTRVFLDGELIEMPGADGLEIEPGEHTVVFKIGDYSLSQAFSVLPGAKCILSVDMAIDVKIE